MKRAAAPVLRGISVLPGSKVSPGSANRALKLALSLYLENASTIVVLVDTEGRPLAGNPAFERLRQGFPAPASLFDLVMPAHRQALADAMEASHGAAEATLEQIEFVMERRQLPCDCILVAAGRQATLILAEPSRGDSDLANELSRVRAALERKAAELEAVVAQADELAHTDTLTLLPNRRAILSELQRQLIYAERYETPLAVSMMDLDGFKGVNDHLGHTAGDEALVTLAGGLRDRIRQPDEIGRYGGDEFLVVLPNAAAAAASQQAARLCQYVRSTTLSLTEGQSTQLTLSAGIAQLKHGVDDWHTLIERADRALYEAKHQGGDRWLILDS